MESATPAKKARLEQEARESAPSPLVFYNLHGPSALDEYLNSPCVTRVIATSFVTDENFMLERWPRLRDLPVFLSSSEDRSSFVLPPNWTYVNARTRCGQYGVPHGKLFVLFENDAVRIVITSSNLCATDYQFRQQIFWTQRFNIKDNGNRMKIGFTVTRNDFREVLLDYLERVGVTKEFLDPLQMFNMEFANVAVVSSVPGAHTKAASWNYGYRRVQRLLDIAKCASDQAVDARGVLYAQVSSVGSLNPTFMERFSLAFGASSTSVIWPSVDLVRRGLNGYEDGLHICLDRQKLEKARSWIKLQYEAEFISPHLKTFFRFRNEASDCHSLAFFLCGSHNISIPAWGREGGNAFSIQSFELSVMFLPFMHNNRLSIGDFTLPFSWRPFGLDDRPWVWDEDHLEPDANGHLFVNRNLVKLIHHIQKA